jgi:divalent metal cation (Fe/Co/Zn/Cd) transporter
MYPGQRFLDVLRSSKDPTVFTVVLEDASDLAGLLIAFFGVFLSARFGGSIFDGTASILIGLVLIFVALLLVRESKGLLTGESADPAMRRRIRQICESDPAVQSANPPLTMYFGPESVLVAVDIQFKAGVPSGEVSKIVERVEGAIRSEFPSVGRIFIEAASLRHVGT